MTAWGARFAALFGALCFAASMAHAQKTHLLVITGLGGEPQYDAAFVRHGAAIVDAARARWGVAEERLVWLASDPTKDPSRMDGRATKEAVGAAFLAMSNRVAPGDLILILLIGHATGEGPASRLNLPGVDATAADYAQWISGFNRQMLVFAVAASGSGDFGPALRAHGRIIITATRTAYERNESHFAEPFVRGLTTLDADGDKDGAVSLLEAFAYARSEVTKWYAAEKKMLSEHAVISDSMLAGLVVLGGARAVDDPRVAPLVAERKVLEDSVVKLRAKKEAMPAADYERELERLLVAIAEATQRIRAAGGRP